MTDEEIAAKLQGEIIQGILTALQQNSPPEAQQSWSYSQNKIRLDKIMNPKAHEAVALLEEGGRTMRMVQKIVPSIVSRVPHRVSGYMRKTKSGIQRIGATRRKNAQPSLEEQATPKQVEESVYVQSKPFIEDVIDNAIDEVLKRNRTM